MKISERKKPNHLEIEKAAHQIDFKFILTRRFLLTLLTLCVIGALLGLFGGKGVFDSKVKMDKLGLLRIEYSPLMREFFSTTLKINIQTTSNEERILLWVSQDYLHQFHIKQIIPKPHSVKVEGKKIIYEFLVALNHSSFNVLFLLEPLSFGFINGNFGVKENNISFKQFIYP